MEVWKQMLARAKESVEYFKTRRPNPLLAAMFGESVKLAEARLANDWKFHGKSVAELKRELKIK